jgi:hypothetical protein
MATDPQVNPLDPTTNMAVLERFKGLWRLDRRIVDQRNNQSGVFQGEAKLTASTNGLDYLEKGLLSFGTAPPMPSVRSYEWRGIDNERIAVHFQDGRYFHTFCACNTQERAEHVCDPDRYVVDYEFLSPTYWTQAWNVTGPRKNYRMISEFRR